MNPEQLISMVMQGKMDMDQLMSQAMFAKLQNHPLMNLFNQMMNGKTNDQKWDTFLNFAESNHQNIHEKRFTEQQVRRLGLIK